MAAECHQKGKTQEFLVGASPPGACQQVDTTQPAESYCATIACPTSYVIYKVTVYAVWQASGTRSAPSNAVGLQADQQAGCVYSPITLGEPPAPLNTAPQQTPCAPPAPPQTVPAPSMQPVRVPAQTPLPAAQAPPSPLPPIQIPALASLPPITPQVVHLAGQTIVLTPLMSDAPTVTITPELVHQPDEQVTMSASVPTGPPTTTTLPPPSSTLPPCPAR